MSVDGGSSVIQLCGELEPTIKTSTQNMWLMYFALSIVLPTFWIAYKHSCCPYNPININQFDKIWTICVGIVDQNQLIYSFFMMNNVHFVTVDHLWPMDINNIHKTSSWECLVTIHIYALNKQVDVLTTIYKQFDLTLLPVSISWIILRQWLACEFLTFLIFSIHGDQLHIHPK